MRKLPIALSATALLIVAVVGGGYGYLAGSLPALDGELALSGLAAEVRVERDALGVPTVKAASRLDAARATGFLHAQDRYFQMDLLRRSAAGELAALVGAAALPLDENVRLHGLRAVARRVLAELPPEDVRLLESYAAGANAGLAALATHPFEYPLLRTEPAPWLPEDSLLVVFAMYLDLQDENAERDARLAALRRAVPESVYRFLTPSGSDWDAPLDASAASPAPLPSAAELDLRGRIGRRLSPLEETDDRMVGSNNWAIGPSRSADGAAWLADDMHLGLGVPNTWYRLRLEWRDEGGSRAVTGLSLPGTPAVVVGSNGAIAWGFTNSYGDWSDRVLLELDPQDPSRYRAPDGFRPFTERVETIAVKGGESRRLIVRETVWGPVIGADGQGRLQALRWTAHDPAATNLELLRLESAVSVQQALALAPRVGVPVQNLLVVDAQGAIGWTLIGRIPRRAGYDLALPSVWADGAGWRGWLRPEEYPRRVDPADAALWTANNRVIGGESLGLLGDGGYALGARARQIRDSLLAMRDATPKDLLALQLDDRALFLARWRELLLTVLDERAVAADPRRGELRRAVEAWGGRAAPESAGYRLVRAYRLFLQRDVLGGLVTEAKDFDLGELTQAEAPLWELVTRQPPHLLDGRYGDWREPLLGAADQVVERFWSPATGFSEATWGQQNRLRMQHPLSRALPALSRWLDMESVPLPGDGHMPRVQSASHGASQRLVVSPGREEASILHMPGGQSGHPLSPFYRKGHRAWVAGEPTPFLPGPPAHALRLVPR